MRDTVAKAMRPFLAALALSLLAFPARAGFSVCNETPKPAKVALGRFDGTRWGSQGWWTIPPKACVTLVKERLNARYYYVYASNGGAGDWDGDHSFCVAVEADFDIPGRQDCAGRGYDRKGFFQVDTGNQRDFTQRLSD